MLNFPLINNSQSRYFLPAKECHSAAKRSVPTFTSCSGDVKDPDGNLLYRINTRLFRTDLMWDDFADFLFEKYKNEEKVNVICHACSAGYEPYSLVSLLKVRYGEGADKFLPIKAKDIDKDCIEMAQKGFLNINMAERMYAEFCLKGQFLKYFKKLSGDVKEEKVKVVDELMQNVLFEMAGIKDSQKEISKDNTVLFFRNVWAYLDTGDIVDLAGRLAANMKNNSLLVIGEWDKEYGIDKLIEAFGFRETHIMNVYEPPGNSIKTKIRANIIAKKLKAQLPSGQLCSVCAKDSLKNIIKNSDNDFSVNA